MEIGKDFAAHSGGHQQSAPIHTQLGHRLRLYAGEIDQEKMTIKTYL